MPYGVYDGPLPVTNRLAAPTYADMRRYGAASGAGFTRLGSEIGSLFGGGGQRDLRQQQAFEQAALSTGRLEDVLQQARQRRDSNIASAAAAQRYRDAAARDPAHADQFNNLADLFQMGKVNPGELSQFFQGQGKIDAMQHASKIANDANGDPGISTGEILERMQPDLALMHGQPLTLTKVEEQNVVDPMVLPESQNITTTAQGQATIGEKGAQAQHALAGAGAERALEAFRSGPQTEAEHALTTQRRAEAAKAIDGGGKQPPAVHFNEPTMVTLFGGQPDESGKAHLDPVKLQRFEATREQLRQSGDPAWNNDAHVLDAQKALDQQDASAAAASGPPADLAPDESGPNLTHFFAPAAIAAALAPAPAQAADAQGRAISDTAAAQGKRKVVRTGVDKKTGTPVVQYDDGSIEAAGAP